MLHRPEHTAEHDLLIFLSWNLHKHRQHCFAVAVKSSICGSSLLRYFGSPVTILVHLMEKCMLHVCSKTKHCTCEESRCSVLPGHAQTHGRQCCMGSLPVLDSNLSSNELAQVKPPWRYLLCPVFFNILNSGQARCQPVNGWMHTLHD